ncbi:MAG: aconitate hydratase [Pseudodesulfovibrio sp.]|uniref:Aconitate hydratase A n=1 Tax=Pseudodesulfovibrio aespoeensis (strain ATCC 700646 / DSM 10631 / Aspo-2) TaxID=643562 RepID=E6VZU9_PSEA9|nr:MULTISPECIES: aconitate hydratase [Pseudodesulfovibrio]MBU4190840.1 aconitate hydratase [Pseudomonadota bacterium]ADU64031.1 aconitate hydratase [Pseudodesulfovibrio aespoeensis Aspo-2]MBU4244567.1 aconitate hydratase [Pseudomonadota bacterium]MBU4475357.1 aconitate hydratase [Pseudomonadota bacterium]MBU4517194.1 aconitate hydratase [Pseudomonadota bacterium]
MGKSITHKIIEKHLVSGEMIPGQEVGLRIDQTLTQDATGTMAWLQFEAINIGRVRTDLSVSYVDHNTLQMGFRNPDDHRYLRTVAAKSGAIFSPAGTGICHQLHLENFAKPGATLIGSDSHTPTAGGIGSMAMGAGGLSVALAMAGEPYFIPMPKVVKVHLTGALTGWAQGKDVILHLLGLLTVKGGVGKVFEYAGPGVAALSVPDRATITNMGAELGATTSIFPSDARTRDFLEKMGRSSDFMELVADADAVYDEVIEIDLSRLEPLVAQPHMPDRVCTVKSLAGKAIDQVAIGSCTNSSYSDLKNTAQILAGRRTPPQTDLLISPGSKQVVKLLAHEGLIEPLLDAGARILECTCGPCIGMGGSPVSAGVSVRTFNRNFEGRSGTQDGQVYLASAQTAARLALDGQFTDPATWGDAPERVELPMDVPSIRDLFVFPPNEVGKDAGDGAGSVVILRGPNIVALEEFDALPATIETTVALKVGDNITTDHILPAGAEITALRSNIPAISQYIFSRVDKEFVARITQAGTGVIVGGENYGQGSSREHAALGPRHLGVKAVIVKSLARIHRANLVNFGILPLLLVNPGDYDALAQDAGLTIPASAITPGGTVDIRLASGESVAVTNDLTKKELEIIQSGGLLNAVRKNQA